MGEGRKQEFSLEYLKNQIADESDKLVDFARQLTWGAGWSNHQVNICKQSINRGDRSIDLVYPNERGYMQLRYDDDGIRLMIRDGKVVLERTSAPGRTGECAWRIMGGAIYRGALELQGNGDILFSVLNGDVYHFSNDGTRKLRHRLQSNPVEDHVAASAGSAAAADTALSLEEFRKWLKQGLPSLYAFQDGRLDYYELQEEVRKHKATGRESAMMTVLLSQFHALAELDGDQRTLSSDDLKVFEERANLPVPDATVRSVWQTLVRVGDRLQNVNWRLWGDFSNPADAVCPEAIKQSWLVGDCSFLAALSAVICAGNDAKESITKMIIAQGDGKFTVKFPGEKESVTVGPFTKDSLLLLSSASKFGLWVLVLESAVAAVLRRERVAKPEVTDQDILDGLDPGKMLELLTGCKSKHYSLAECDSPGVLAVAAQWKLPVVASRSVKPNGPGPDDSGIFAGHAYSVHYDERTGKVIVRNPWGAIPESEPTGLNGEAIDGNLDGCVTLSLDEFERSFSAIFVASR